MGLRHQGIAVAVSAALLTSSAAAEDGADRTEMLEADAARMQARVLLPTFADQVMDGERRVTRTAQWVSYLGLLYRFRLYPEPVPFHPVCEMRTLSLNYEFAQPRDESGPPKDYDLIAMQRSGAFKSGALTTQSQFLELTPAPQSEDEHRTRCRSVADADGWLSAANASEFRSASRYLAQLRTDLAVAGDDIKLECVRDRKPDCPVNKEMILRTIEQARKDFSEIRLSNGTRWLEYRYWDELTGGAEITSVIVEMHLEQIDSVTIVHDILVTPVL